MTQAARISSTPTSKDERAHQVEGAVHSARMEGLDLAPADAADAAEYVAGRISLDEYGHRVRARYGVPEESGQGSNDPVAVFDAMWEAGTSLFGSYVWLKRHARDEDEASRWWEAARAVKARRSAVDARDMDAQRRMMAEFVAEERVAGALVRA